MENILPFIPSSVKTAISVLDSSAYSANGFQGISDLINHEKKSFKELGFQNLAEVEGFLKEHGTNIRRVDLSGLGAAVGLTSNNRLKNIAEYCPNIESLSFAIETPKEIDEICKIKSLKYLSLANSLFLNDTHLLKILSRHKNLGALKLSNCRSLTDAAIKHIAQHLTGLRSLKLSYCHNLADEAIKLIAQHLSGLQSLNLLGCLRLTPQGIQYLQANLPRLRLNKIC